MAWGLSPSGAAERRNGSLGKKRDSGKTPGNSCMWSWVRAQPDQGEAQGTERVHLQHVAAALNAPFKKRTPSILGRGSPRWEVGTTLVKGVLEPWAPGPLGLCCRLSPRGGGQINLPEGLSSGRLLSIKKWVTGEDWAHSRSGYPVLMIRFQGRLWWPLQTHILWYSWRREGKSYGVGTG